MKRKATFSLVGREAQQKQLRQAERSRQAELIAVVGRRRVGKTYLVRQYFSETIRFDLTGTRDASLREQLETFTMALSRLTGFQHARPASWQEAFRELERALVPVLKKRGRHVLFFDEMPWLAGRNSRFLRAFEQFWNGWASNQPTLIVVICGSATSWMIAKVFRNRGGLHNRVTRRVSLQPFTLGETEAYLRWQGIRWERSAIAEVYMALGGIPFYLGLIPKGVSPAQAIDSLVRGADAPLKLEFEELYAALFDRHENHLAVVRALAKKQIGLTRGELIKATGLASGGGLTRVLDELEASGFIRTIIPFGRSSRDGLHRLMDEYTLFHLRWGKRRGAWTSVRGKPAWRAWSGYAFENLCFRHSEQILGALGISGIETSVSSWRYLGKAGEEGEVGAQIDMVIDRADEVVNLCEMKWTDAPLRLTRKEVEALRRKRGVFQAQTRTRKSLLTMLVSRSGVENPGGEVDAEVRLEDLFL